MNNIGQISSPQATILERVNQTLNKMFTDEIKFNRDPNTASFNIEGDSFLNIEFSLKVKPIEK